MHKLRQLHLRELGEGSGKRGLMRRLPGRIPTEDSPQLSVLRQPLRPTRPFELGMNRARGMISKVATRRRQIALTAAAV